MIYKPPYTVNTKMINYISEIMKLVGEITAEHGVEQKPKLRRTNKIQSIHSSLAIEDNVLSEKQVKDIINGKTVIGPKRDIMEVQNALRCYDQILEINPYSFNELLRCHAAMMEGLVNDAGYLRTGQEGVFDGDEVIFVAPPADKVHHLLTELFEYLNEYEENFLIKSTVFHYEFEFIHPFSDGNGRMGRLFQTCILADKESIFAYLPIESIIKERQQVYYEVIDQSNKAGNSDVFIEFMLDAILESVKRMSTATRHTKRTKSPQMDKLLGIMEEDVPYTLRELMTLVGLKSRASFKRHYLDPALETGLVSMTIPDKPTSRNQRYMKTI